MATQKVYCSYQEIIDLHTESDKVSVLGIHLPTGDTPHRMFKGLYDQFKKFRYLGCDITLVPTARLPVDPLQVSYEAGEPTIDPRDVLNPIMFHGCHGEDLGNILNSLYTVGDVSGSGTPLADILQSDAVDLTQMANVTGYLQEDLFEKLYYKALTDNTWRKANPQRGFKKSGLRPLIYKMASTHQIMPSESMDHVSPENFEDLGLLGFPDLQGNIQSSIYAVPHKSLISQSILTNKLTSLGWLDTRTPLDNVEYTQQLVSKIGPSWDINSAVQALYLEHGHLTELPKIFMGVILMPPAYKTEQYFRLIVNHRFEFARFRSISFQNDIATDSPAYHNWDEEISNDLGSGGDDAVTLELKSQITTGFPTPNGVEFSLYSTLSADDVDHTCTASSHTGCFALYDGKVYFAAYRSTGVYIKISSTQSIAITDSGVGNPISSDTTFTLSPEDSDLHDDLIDGGIEYGE